MSAKSSPGEEPRQEKKKQGCLLPLAVFLLVAVAGLLWVRYNFFASSFAPTRLTPREAKALETKLDRLEGLDPAPAGADTEELQPYSEKGADRTVRFTERELNGLIAEDEEAAKRVALRLSDELVTIRLVLPLEEDVPVLGGSTLRLKAGVELAYRDGHPLVVLKGVSLGGVPLPNAWLGNLKNANLVEEFGGESGFWSLLADGVAGIEVRDGYLRVTLRE